MCMEAIIVLFVTLCPMNTQRCYRTIQSEYTSAEECYIDLSMHILEVDQTRYYSCISAQEASTLMAGLPTAITR